MSWRNEALAVWAVTVRNALMSGRNVFFFFELVFWPIVGILSIGLMSRFLELTSAQASLEEAFMELTAASVEFHAGEPAPAGAGAVRDDGGAARDDGGARVHTGGVV